MKRILADLHIHTVLSPCAGEEMTPPAIVRAAVAKGLDMIAICDHNSAGNVRATQEAAGDDLAVLAGMEVTTAEEVHVLGLFPDAASAAAAAEEVLATLPDQPGPAGATVGARHASPEEAPQARGRGMPRPYELQAHVHGGERQWLMDAGGRVVGSEKKMLSAASTFALDQAVGLIKRHGGMAVASHVDRPSFSVMSQLGLFPREAGFDAIEVFSGAAKPDTSAKWAALGLPILRSSDSHYLAEIASRTTCLTMRGASFKELHATIRRGFGGPSGGA